MAQSVFYDGKQDGQFVKVRFAQGRVLIDDVRGQRLASWELARTSRLPRSEQAGEYHLTLGGRARLILRDPAEQQLLDQHNRAAPSFWTGDKKIIGTIGAVALLLWLVVWQGIPLLAQPIVALIPQKVDRQLGEQARNLLVAQEVGGCADTQGVKALTRLRAHLFDDPQKVEIMIVDSDQENALALPGGFILIFRGLLDEARSPALVASVIAHEQGHIVARHGMRKLVSSAMIWLFYAVITWDFFSIPAVILVALADTQYTRSMEEEADRFAWQIMREKQIDPRPISEWFMRQDKLQNLPSYLQTHPPSSERAVFFSQEQWQTRPSLTPQEWVALKNICSDSS